MAKDRIAIVGAGMAGLAAAAVLAPHARVSVFERSDRPGGKIRREALGEREIDCGPTVFTLKPIFEQVFRACGERLDEHVSLRPLDILARHAWPDGSRLDLHADRQRSAEAIAAFAGPREAKAYLSYLKMAKRTWETLYSPMIEQESADFARLLASTPPHLLVRLNPYVSLWKELSGRFRDGRLRQLFGRYTTYCGSSPFEAPGVMAMIAHIEQEGVWAIEGGIAALAQALARIAEARGAAFSYGAEIRSIETKNGRAEGVNGEPFDVVLFNGDVAALDTLVQGRKLKDGARRSLSAATLAFEGTAEGFDTEVHNVFFSTAYRDEFEAIFARGELAREPTVYLYAPDSASGAAKQRFFCLMNAPPDGDTHTYTEKERELCRSRILAHLTSCGLTLTTDTDGIVTTMPDDFSKRFPATGGALYGQPIHGWRASFQRPGIRTATERLYCAGGSVHPGSGVPMAALSGLMAARAIMKDCALTARSSPAGMRGGMSMH